MKPQSQQKSQQAKLTWDDVLKYPPHRKISVLQNSYPSNLRYSAGRVIEQSGIESHDLLFWELVHDIKKANILSTTCNNTSELKAQLEKLSVSVGKFDERINELSASAGKVALLRKEVGDIKKQLEESATSSQVKKLQTTFGTILANQKKAKATSKKLSRKEALERWKDRWLEWMRTPQGIVSSSIAVLLLLNLIFK